MVRAGAAAGRRDVTTSVRRALARPPVDAELLVGLVQGERDLQRMQKERADFDEPLRALGVVELAAVA
jgi:hypothetical protein